MKKRLLTLSASLILLLSAVIPGLAFAKNVNLLFLQTAHDAKIVPQKNNTFLITMKGLDKYVCYFSDRPNRLTGLVKTSDFLSFWTKSKKNNFSVTPPNVAISSAKMMNGKEKRVEIFASLSKPYYNALNNTMSFVLTPLNKNKTKLTKMDLGYTVIFFDDLMVHWNPDGL